MTTREEDDKATNNLLLNITLNIFIISAAASIVSPKMQNTDLPKNIASLYVIPLILLIFCYIFVQLSEDTEKKKEIIGCLSKMLPWNLLITNCLLIFSSIIDLFLGHNFLISILASLICICIGLNILLPIKYIRALRALLTPNLQMKWLVPISILNTLHNVDALIDLQIQKMLPNAISNLLYDPKILCKPKKLICIYSFVLSVACLIYFVYTLPVSSINTINNTTNNTIDNATDNFSSIAHNKSSSSTINSTIFYPTFIPPYFKLPRLTTA